MIKSFFNWSGGKDSTLALYHVLNSDSYKVDELLTTISAEHQRISMHGVRLDLLKKQADSIKIPLRTIELPESADMDAYNQLMQKTMQLYRDQGIYHAIFGDIFLEDLKRFREENLAKLGMNAVFPIWKRDSRELVTEFIELGFEAITVAIDASVLDRSFCGRIINKQFIKELPAGIDPCGENGEFHSFVFNGPIFNQPVPIKIGEIVQRSYKSDQGNWNSEFFFCDLI